MVVSALVAIHPRSMFQYIHVPYSYLHLRMYSSQIFRHTDEEDDRVRAQVIVKCVFVKGRQVINASDFLKDQAAIESGLVDAVHRSKATDHVAEIIDCFEELRTSSLPISRSKYD